MITVVASLLAAAGLMLHQTMRGCSAWQIGFLSLSGAFASMGASALNHYYDRDIDKIMVRTSKRPIPAGRLSPNTVLFYGIGLCILSVVISWLTLNPVATGMIALGIFFYVIIYTVWLKRWNASNIVIGGFAGSGSIYGGVGNGDRLN